MPSLDLLPKSASAFTEEERWLVNGNHYSKTLEAWLEKQDANEPQILKHFKATYGKDAPSMDSKMAYLLYGLLRTVCLQGWK